MLLAGCQSPKDQEKATTLDCFVPRNDRGKDSLREYYERMERWDVVHGTDFVLGTVNAGALRRVVDDIDEVGEIFGVDGDCNLLGFYRANSKTALA